MDFIYKRSYLGPVKAVIFDWAGTISDHGCIAPSVVFVELFKKFGVPITMEQSRQPMGAHKKDHIREITQMPEIARKWEEVHGKTPNENDVETMFNEFVPMQIKALSDHSKLIPGTLAIVQELRNRGIKIGTCTGYTKEMLDVLLEDAKKQGFEPDASRSATEVPAGRPHPWMALQVAMDMQVYPMESIVKIGDTLPDIDEGLNAGMWSVGVVLTGNEIGMTEDELKNANPKALQSKKERAYQIMSKQGAHFIIDEIKNLIPVIDEINSRLAHGEKP